MNAAEARREHLPPGPGQVLGGTYRLEAVLGRGRATETFRATFLPTGMPAAIRMLRPEIALDAAAMSLFRQRGRALAALRDPAIVACAGVFDDAPRGIAYLVMELIEGPTLADRLDEGPMPVDLVLAVGARLARGMSSLHAAGIVHGGLSAAAIRLQGGDLSLATILGVVPGASVPAIERAGGVNPATPYLAPEQLGLFGGAPDRRADIFSLGLLLGALALGRALDPRTAPSALRDSRRTKPELDALPPALRSLLSPMLEPDPARRVGSIAEIKFPVVRRIGPAALRRLPPSPVGAAPAQSKSRILAWTGAAAALVIATVLIAEQGRDPSATRQSAAAVVPSTPAPAIQQSALQQSMIPGDRTALAGGADAAVAPATISRRDPEPPVLEKGAVVWEAKPQEELLASPTKPVPEAAAPRAEAPPAPSAPLAAPAVPVPAIAPSDTDSPRPDDAAPASGRGDLVAMAPPPLAEVSKPAGRNPAETPADTLGKSPDSAPAATPGATRAEIDRILADPPCSRLQAAIEDQAIAVSGFISRPQDRQLLTDRLAEASPGSRLIFRANLVPAPFCQAMLEFARAAPASPRAAMPEIGSVRPSYRIGDGLDIVLRNAGTAKARFYLSVIDDAGEVRHLLPATALDENEILPGKTLTFGGRRASGQPEIKIEPPAGKMMVLAVSSASPLFGIRPTVEPAADYLRALDAHLAAGRAAYRWVMFDVAGPGGARPAERPAAPPVRSAARAR